MQQDPIQRFRRTINPAKVLHEVMLKHTGSPAQSLFPVRSGTPAGYDKLSLDSVYPKR